MNYCRKCQSDYEKPGTCNCFAAEPPRDMTQSHRGYPAYPPYVWIWRPEVKVPGWDFSGCTITGTNDTGIICT